MDSLQPYSSFNKPSMLNDVQSNSQTSTPPRIVLLLNGKSVKNCHIVLPDLPKPVAAIAYDSKFYSYVRFYSEMEAAQRAAARLIMRGNEVILTQVQRGLILWVFEPDAQLAGALRA